MTNERFVDTSGWAAWVVSADPMHESAVAAFAPVLSRNGRFVTTTYVMAELTALFIRIRLPRERQIAFFEDISTVKSVIIVPTEATVLNDAWNLWRSRPDKKWTLTDCASFVVMGQRGIIEAITTDHHFEQAGFIQLLK